MSGKTIKASDKLKDSKGNASSVSIGDAIAAELIKDLATDSDGPGGVARKKIRWALAKKMSAGGDVALTQDDIDNLKAAHICIFPLSVFGPLMDALGEQ